MFVFLFFLSGCEKGNETTVATEYSVNNKNIITGGITKGVLVGATVRAYNIAIDGSVDYSLVVASAVTDSNGLFELGLPQQRGYLLLESSAGEFIDETDQNPNLNDRRKIVFSESEGLATVLPPTLNTVALTIISESIYEKTKNEFGDDFYSVYLINISNFEAGLGFNPLSTISADPINPDPNASTAAKMYALMSGGLANIINQVSLVLGHSVPTYDVVKAVIVDFSDGNIDGTADGVTVQVDGVDIPTNLNLDNAIERYRNNNFANFESTSLPEIDYTVMEVNANLFPVVRAGEEQTVNELALVFLEGTATVANATIVSTLWTQTQGVEVTLSDDSILNPTFTSPSVAADTNLVFKLTATDSNNGSSEHSVTVNVHANIAPSVDAGPNQNVDEQMPVNLNGTVTDIDGIIVSFEWTQTQGTNVQLSDVSSLTPTFTAPNLTSDEALVFELSATDDIGDSNSSSVSINVTANMPPAVDAGAEQNVNEQVLVSLIGTVSDSDGTVISFGWVQIQGTPVALSDSNLINPTFTSPSISVDEILIFELSAIDDDGDTNSDSVSINIHANLAPAVNAGTTQNVDEQSPVSLVGTVGDSDGTVVSFGWSQTQGTTVVLSDESILNPTFTSPSITVDETLIFELSATDNHNDTSAHSVSINVHANLAPVIDAGPDQTQDEKTLINLAGTANDSDGTITSIAWAQTQGAVVVLSDATILTPSFTAPDIGSNQTAIFELTVTDNLGDASVDTVSINLIANIAPTIAMPADQTVGVALPVTLTATGSDSDGAVTSYQWTQTAGPAVTISNANSQTATFTSITTTTPASSTFSLTVTDNDGDTATQTTNVIVQPVLISSLAFSDANLATCVTAYAATWSFVYVHDYVKLYCDTTSILDLTGLSALESLDTVNLFTNSTPALSDISGLAGLEYVTSLTLSGNLISDVSPISGFTLLKTLGLNGNNISDISSLSALTSLTQILISNNSVTDITAIAGMTSMDTFNISNNGLTNIAPLSGLSSLTSLTLTSNNISDVSPLAGLTSLTSLQLSSNSISNVTNLSGLTNLQLLNIGTNSVSDISSLAGLTGLTSLQMNDNSISDISTLSVLTGLTSFTFHNNSISDISAVVGMTSMTNFFASNNGISDISSIAGMSAMNFLTLGTNSITDVSVLKVGNFPGITYLSLNGNTALADFTGVETLTTLTTLDVQNTAEDCGDVAILDAALSTTTILHAVGCTSSGRKVEGADIMFE